MPIYEYKCLECGQRTEIIHKVNEGYPRKCKKCGGALEKMISAPAIQFKGSGWYITDYARKSPPANDSGSASKPSESQAAPEKTEAKPETSTSKSD